MRSWVVVVVVAAVSLARSAVASPSDPSAADGSRSAHLLDSKDSLPPPPLVEAPEQAPPQPAPTPPPTAGRVSPPIPQLEADPSAGSIVGGEIALGALLVLGVDAISIAAGLGVAMAMIPSGGGSGLSYLGAFAALYVGALVALAIDFALAPLGAALGAHLASRKRGDNGMLGALLGAYAMQLVALGALGASVLTAGASGSPLSSLLGIVAVAMHYLGLPIGASLGIHWGTARRATTTPPQPAGPARLATRPDELHASAMPSIASPIVSWTF
jgi:hypothetical protein